MTLAAVVATALLPVFAVAPGERGPSGLACERARWFLINRHLDPAYLDSSGAALAATAHTGRANEERLAIKAHLFMVRGEDEEDPQLKARLYAAARAAADSLRAANEKNPLGHVWWAAAQGRLLEQRNMVAAAAGVAQVRRENERALELDPGCALASFALGRMYEELPRLLGGNLKKAERFLRQGVTSDPNYTVIRLELARVLARQGRREDAVTELRRLLAVTTPTEPAENALNDRPAAVALLQRLAGGPIKRR